MKHIRQQLITASLRLVKTSFAVSLFCCLLPMQSIAVAPVVDDSENFAILDEQQADSRRPVAQNNYNEVEFNETQLDEEKALAHDEPTGKIQNQGNVELLDKIQGMQQDIQELRGQLEVQSHDLKLLKEQQLAFYKDIDTRLRQVPAASSAAATTKPLSQSATSAPPAPTTSLSLNQPAATLNNTPDTNASTNPTTQITTPSIVTNTSVVAAPASSNHNNPADEQISYMAAYELVKSKRFDDAINAMQTFLTQYPNGGYTANAQYWLGELYMVKKDYPNAIQHFEVVLSQYPNSSKSAASLLKVGYALAASGKPAEARQKLSQVLKNYPDTPTAQLAAAKLKSLNAS